MSDPMLTLAQSTLKHRLEDIPDSVRPHIKMGFGLLRRLNEKQIIDLSSYIIENFARRGNYDLDKAVLISGIDRKLIGDALSSIALTVGALYDLDVSENDFFNFLPTSLIDHEDHAAILSIVNLVINKRDAISRDVQDSRLANAVLPSFSDIECEVDVRFKFDDADKITARSSLAVIYLSTDSKDDIWFQIAPDDLKVLIEKLSLIERRLAIISDQAF